MRIRTVSAAALALGLVIASSALGLTAANAAGAVTLDYPSAASTITDQYPEFSGSAPAGTTVTVVDSSDSSELCVVAAADDGTWACTPSSSLSYGDYTVYASALGTEAEASPITSDTVSFTVAPVPEITLDSPDPIYQTDISLSFTGSSNRQISSVQITFADDSTGVCTVSQEDSSWSCDYSSPGGLPPGAATLGFSFAGDGSVEESFTVLPIDDEGTPNITDYVFAPGAVTVIGDPTSPATVVGTQLEFLDEMESPPGCPDLSSEPSSDFPGITPGHFSCTFSGLHAGPWGLTSYQDIGDGLTRATGSIDRTFFIPQPPVITTVSGNAANVVTFSGDVGTAEQYQDYDSDEDVDEDYRAVPGDLIHVYNGDATLCTAVVQDDDSWSCSTSTALAGGTYSIQAAAEDHPVGCECDSIPGGLSALSAPVVNLTLPTLSSGGSSTPADTTPTTPPTPPAPSTPVWTFNLSGLDLSHVHPGQTFTITGSGLPPGSVITIELHSTPVSLGTVTVAPDGSFSLSGTIPAGIAPGAHHIVATLTGSGLAPTTVDKAITVEDATSGAGAAATSGSTTQGEANTGTHQGGVVGDPNDPGNPIAPNVLTNGLNSIADVLVHPQKVPSALAVGLVLLIFAILPAHLLNATISEQYDHLVRRLPRLQRTPHWLAGLRAWLGRAPVIGGLAITSLTALLFGFVDPKFGFTLASLRLFLAVAIALFIVVYAANAIAGRIVRKRWDVDVELSIRPLGLVLTVVGVVISRALDFSPGFLIGLVLGLSIAGKSAASHAWKAVLIRSGIVIGVALVAWLGYSAFPAGQHEGSSFLSELMLETLVAITTEGVVALLVELLPIRLLEGERLYKHSRVLWGAVYLALLVIFIVAVVPWEGNWAELGSSLWSWLTVVIVFGVICVAIYVFFRIRSRNEHEDEHADKDLVSISDNE